MGREESLTQRRRGRREERRRRTERLRRWSVGAHPYTPRVGHPQVFLFGGVRWETQDPGTKPVPGAHGKVFSFKFSVVSFREENPRSTDRSVCATLNKPQDPGTKPVPGAPESQEEAKPNRCRGQTAEKSRVTNAGEVRLRWQKLLVWAYESGRVGVA